MITLKQLEFCMDKEVDIVEKYENSTESEAENLLKDCEDFIKFSGNNDRVRQRMFDIMEAFELKWHPERLAWLDK